jgi:hypothetical protein
MEEAEAKQRGTWKAMGKDAKLKGKARGQRWKGLAKGRNGPPNANGEDVGYNGAVGAGKSAAEEPSTNGVEKLQLGSEPAPEGEKAVAAT